MIKKSFITFTFLILVLISYSQNFFNESKKGLNISSEIGNFGIYLFPNLTIDYKKHSFAIGPIFRFYPKFTNFDKYPNDIYIPTKESYFGFHLLYQYNFRPNNIFDYFVQTNMTYENLELSHYKNAISNSELNFEWETKYLYETIGAGFKINFTKKLYTTMSLDIGVVLYEKLSSDAEKIRKSNQFVNYITGILRIGIGYKF